MERFNGISVFVEVGRCRRLFRRPPRLNLSRSAVGKTVSRLERRLGVASFTAPQGRRVLTEEGQRFYEQLPKKRWGEIRTAEDLLESGKQEIRGRLRISNAGSSSAANAWRRCFATCCGRIPVWNSISPSTTGSVDRLDEGFDLAIRNSPLGNGSGLMMRTVAEQRMTVCASACLS